MGLRPSNSLPSVAASPFLCTAPQIRRSRQTSCGPRWSPPWRRLAQPHSSQLRGHPRSARPRWRSSASDGGQWVTHRYEWHAITNSHTVEWARLGSGLQDDHTLRTLARCHGTLSYHERLLRHVKVHSSYAGWEDGIAVFFAVKTNSFCLRRSDEQIRFNCLQTTCCFLSLHESQRPQVLMTGRSLSLLLSNTIRCLVEGSGSRRTSEPVSRAAVTAKTSLHAPGHMLPDDAAKQQLLSHNLNRNSMVSRQKIEQHLVVRKAKCKTIFSCFLTHMTWTLHWGYLVFFFCFVGSVHVILAQPWEVEMRCDKSW